MRWGTHPIHRVDRFRGHDHRHGHRERRTPVRPVLATAARCNFSDHRRRVRPAHLAPRLSPMFAVSVENLSKSCPVGHNAAKGERYTALRDALTRSAPLQLSQAPQPKRLESKASALEHAKAETSDSRQRRHGRQVRLNLMAVPQGPRPGTQNGRCDQRPAHYSG